MSRGLGKLQRSALAEVASGGLLDSIEVAGRVFDTRAVSDSQDSATRRALRALARRGLLVDMSRAWHNKRRYWATPEEAARYHARVREVFRSRA